MRDVDMFDIFDGMMSSRRCSFDANKEIMEHYSLVSSKESQNEVEQLAMYSPITYIFSAPWLYFLKGYCREYKLAVEEAYLGSKDDMEIYSLFENRLAQDGYDICALVNKVPVDGAIGFRMHLDNYDMIYEVDFNRELTKEEINIVGKYIEHQLDSGKMYFRKLHRDGIGVITRTWRGNLDKLDNLDKRRLRYEADEDGELLGEAKYHVFVALSWYGISDFPLWKLNFRGTK